MRCCGEEELWEDRWCGQEKMEIEKVCHIARGWPVISKAISPQKHGGCLWRRPVNEVSSTMSLVSNMGTNCDFSSAEIQMFCSLQPMMPVVGPRELFLPSWRAFPATQRPSGRSLSFSNQTPFTLPSKCFWSPHLSLIILILWPGLLHYKTS